MTELTISISDLRKHFDEYLQLVKLGKPITITMYGKPVAEFLPAGTIQDRQTQTPTFERKKKRK